MARTARGAKSKAAAKANPRNAIPNVYSEMLDEAVSSPTRNSEDGTPVKRRRVGGRIVIQSVDDNEAQQPEQSIRTGGQQDIDDLFEEPRPTPQHIEQTESEESVDSDEDFEDVDLGSNPKEHDAYDGDMKEPVELNLVLGGDSQKTPKSAQVRQKPITSIEKKLRLEIHKIHLCGLLAHVHLRNHWCNDESAHTALKNILTKKTVSYLNPDESRSQFQRSRSFMDGLTQASDAFRAVFKITARGMSKPRWADSPETLALLQPPDDIDLPMQKSDFIFAAGKHKGSRDVGAQLFCAMLRAAGVDARLVCSMLPLPFQPAQKVTLSQVMRNASRLPHHRSRQVTPEPDSEADAASDGSPEGNIGSSRAEIRSRLGPVGRGASPEASSSKVSSTPKRMNRKPIRESKYPVYWVEAFNEAVQKWVPVDPLVTKTLSKPSKFEPPAGDPGNNMSYVIAFEDDGSARDVTRRYAKAYNAKTRRDRVEVTKDGDKWWRRVMSLYRRSHGLDRDQVEDAELAAKEAAEPMPRSVQDFKDHPYYALERHLRRHETVHPKREVGKIGAGRPGSTNTLEPIYRRRDVHQLKSADKWYRMGREIKVQEGEQPLKRVAVRRPQESTLDPDDMDAADDDNAGTALYAPYQTIPYTAPSVVHGRIPKNVYGNLDVYVPNMVPPGGVHIQHPETARAARLLGIDYADAITGFSFKGRHGTAITTGAVVAAESSEAVGEVIKAFDDERAQAEEERRSLAALKMWKRFLAALRIRERIEGYDIEGERNTAMKYEMEKDEDEGEEEDEGGGFLPDRGAEEIAQPTAKAVPTRNSSDVENEDEGGGFCMSEDEQEEVEVPQVSDPFVNRVDDDDDGNYDDGGGFHFDDEEQNAITEISEEGHQATNDEHTATLTKDDVPQIVGHVGGFLPDDHETNSDIPPADDSIKPFSPVGGVLEKNGSISPHDASQVEGHPEEAFPDLPADELEEARVLQQLYESQGSEHRPVSRAYETTPAPRTSPDPPHIPETEAESERETSAEALPSNEPVAEEDVEPESSEDADSLLSHDPDDEDADPEWLA